MGWAARVWLSGAVLCSGLTGCGEESPSPTGPGPSDPPSPAACGVARLPRINAPGFGRAEIPFNQTAIAWFGTLSPERNHADIRVGYNDAGLYVYFAVFDRHLWYDPRPDPATLTQWDAVTLLLDTAGGDGLSPASWRFVAQLSQGPAPAWQAAYRGGAGGWQPVSVAFEARPGWRGEALNDNRGTDRGWAMGFTIPFAQLGLSRPPPLGAQWRLAAILHDRDGPAEPPLPDQRWPSAMQENSPLCWAWLRFGLPTYAPGGTPTGRVQIYRPTQDSPLVPDADVGGAIANQCPGDDGHIWGEWANRNYGQAPDFNVQNQSDVADWPCFARYYVTFPLEAVPPGQVILKATLTLHQFGSSTGRSGARSWIQVLLANGDWQERTITWNNAPQAEENLGGSWVEPIDFPGWPGVARTWDVTYGAAKAYRRGEPLRLVLYSADADYHTGKYFVSSDTEDWNRAARPRLEVWWRGEQKSP